MTPIALTSQLEDLSIATGETLVRYKDNCFWASVGECELDHQLTQLADIFVNVPIDQQQIVRDAIRPGALWNLIAYVRRLSVLISKTSDPIWLRRALAVAAIEDGRFDFRDTIVSLVIARAAAEQVGIDYIAHFNWCLQTFKPSSRDSFTNARDHSESNVRGILRSFGPP